MTATDTVTADAPPDTRSTLRQLIGDPAVLPSATTLRFATLVLLTIATAGSVYGYIGILTHPDVDATVRRCLSDVSVSSAISSQASPTNPFLDCTGPYVSPVVAWTVLGILLVVAANLAVYLAMPWWMRRFRRIVVPRRLRPPAPGNATEQHAATRIAALAAEMNPRGPAPTVLVNPHDRTTDARVFGWQRRAYLQVNVGVLLAVKQDPDQFDAIVRHELAHIRNRDIRPSAIALSAWWVYVVVVLLPFATALVAPGLFQAPGTAVRVGLTVPAPHVVVAVLVLSALVLLTQRAVLRVRESHADAVAAGYGTAAMAASLTARAAERAARRGPAVLADHPDHETRVADLTDPARLSGVDSTALFGAGVAVAIIAVNVGFLLWIGGLLTGPLTGVLHRYQSGHVTDAVLLPVLLYGPPALLSLAIVVRLMSVTMWRSALCRPFGGRPAPVWRVAGPLVAGYMIGAPLSVLYADAGYLGIFDVTPGTRAADVALSAAALLLIFAILARWMAESAAVWIPVSGASLRRACAAAGVAAGIGAAPVFFTFTVVHDNADVRGLTVEAAHLAGWFGSGWVFSTYLPLTFLQALPAAGFAVAVPCLFVAAASLRRRAAPPRWAPPAAVDRLSVRPPGRVGTAVATGLLVAAVSVALSFVAAAVLRLGIGADALSASRVYGGNTALLVWFSWIAYTVMAVAAVVVARQSPVTPLTSALLMTFVATAWADLPLPVPLFFALCGPGTPDCITRQLPGTAALYGEFAAQIPLVGALVAACAVPLGMVLARRSTGGPDRRPAWPLVAVVALTVLVAASGVYAYAATDFIR